MTHTQHTQHDVARLVAERPGITPFAVRNVLLYHGYPSNRYAYALVHRAAKAGLIELRERADKRGCYRCYPASHVFAEDGSVSHETIE